MKTNHFNEFWLGGWFFVISATALAYAGLAVAAVGTYTTVYGQKQQAATSAATARYNARVTENAAIQGDMEDRENIRRKREQNLLLMGAGRAQAAAQGVISAGSPLEVLAYNAGTLELQVSDDARAAESKRRGLMNQAEQLRVGGAATASAYRTAATGSLLSGVADFAGKAGTSYGNGSLKFGSKAA